MNGNIRKVEFWMSGRGNRNETKIVDLPIDYSEDEIKQELDNWLYDLRSNSDYIRYGWRNLLK